VTLWSGKSHAISLRACDEVLVLNKPPLILIMSAATRAVQHNLRFAAF